VIVPACRGILLRFVRSVRREWLQRGNCLELMSDNPAGARERIVSANGIELCYETCGDSRQPALMLIMGLGFQLVHWPERFCQQL
jgi:hypothetical protein